MIRRTELVIRFNSTKAQTWLLRQDTVGADEENPGAQQRRETFTVKWQTHSDKYNCINCIYVCTDFACSDRCIDLSHIFSIYPFVVLLPTNYLLCVHIRNHRQLWSTTLLMEIRYCKKLFWLSCYSTCLLLTFAIIHTAVSPLTFTAHLLCNQLIINYAQLGILIVKGLRLSTQSPLQV